MAPTQEVRFVLTARSRHARRLKGADLARDVCAESPGNPANAGRNAFGTTVAGGCGLNTVRAEPLGFPGMLRPSRSVPRNRISDLPEGTARHRPAHCIQLAAREGGSSVRLAEGQRLRTTLRPSSRDVSPKRTPRELLIQRAGTIPCALPHLPVSRREPPLRPSPTIDEPLRNRVCLNTSSAS